MRTIRNPGNQEALPIAFSWIPGLLIYGLRDSAEWIRSINCDQGSRPSGNDIVRALMSISPGAQFPAFSFSSTTFSIVRF